MHCYIYYAFYTLNCKIHGPCVMGLDPRADQYGHILVVFSLSTAGGNKLNTWI